MPSQCKLNLNFQIKDDSFKILAETMNNLDRLLKSPGSRKRPILIKEMADIVQAAENFHSGR